MIQLSLKSNYRKIAGLVFVSLFFSFVSICQSVEILTKENPITKRTLACDAPTVQATNITFSFIGQNGIRLHWIKGNGSKRIVKISPVNSFTPPLNGDDPVASTLYNGIGEQIVYNGIDTTILVTGLAPSSNYCFRVYEADCVGASIIYSTATGVNNPICQNTAQGCANYIFTGNGNWSVASNWYLNAIPPSPLPDCSGISINPAGTGLCILNVPQVISQDASFSILPGKTLVVQGNFVITSPPPLPCPSFILTHTAGFVAPITKTITYGTVITDISGVNKCWITQNLGSNNQATAATDPGESAAGWYWQFNRSQGYKHDGIDRTPNTTWVSSISDLNSWTSANDPCRLLINSSWRIPTSTEWTTADGAWNNYDDTYNSVLKLHSAGNINTDGILVNRGVGGYYWSSDQVSSTRAYNLYLGSSASLIDNFSFKSNGYSLRCIRD